jgi:cytochrome c
MTAIRLALLAALFAPALAAPAAAQDAAAGERSWNKCRACHQIGETAKNIVGPQLNGLFGRTAGTVEGYSYSAANKNSGIVWDEAVFAGIKNEKEIADLTAFLKQFGKDGKKL